VSYRKRVTLFPYPEKGSSQWEYCPAHHGGSCLNSVGGRSPLLTGYILLFRFPARCAVRGMPQVTLQCCGLEGIHCRITPSRSCSTLVLFWVGGLSTHSGEQLKRLPTTPARILDRPWPPVLCSFSASWYASSATNQLVTCTAHRVRCCRFFWYSCSRDTFCHKYPSLDGLVLVSTQIGLQQRGVVTTPYFSSVS
jgi:hypothetical protein